MNDYGSVTVTAYPVQMDSGLVKVDVNVENVPENLFGASFHLDVSGGDWDIEGYSDGNVFGGVTPIVLIREKNGVIFAGVSLTRGDNADVSDGTLLSFYLRPLSGSEMYFEFDNQVLSAFDNGRVDLQNVEWADGSLEISVAETGTEEFFPDGNEDEEEYESMTSGSVNLLYNPEKNGQIDVGSMTDLYVFLGVSFAVLVGLFLAYSWYRKQR